MSTALATFSQEAQRRLRQPPRRGMFEPIDAARSQRGLLTVGDPGGQLRIYWLVDLETQRIEDARFLSFGELASHAVGDAYSERCRGLTVEEACHLDPALVEADLRDEPATPAFGEDGDAALAAIADIQARALAELPRVELLPEPVEVQRYERKRQQDWSEDDTAWLPLSLLRKLGRVDKALKEVLAHRLKRTDIGYEVAGLHDDFQLKVTLSGIEEEEKPTVLQFFQSELRNDIHPQITVQEA